MIERIRNELELQGKTQKDLMNYLGKSENLFTEWNAGRTKSYTKYVYQIAEFLNVSVEYLKGDTDIKKEATIGDLDNEKKKLIEIIDSLPEDDRQKIIEYARLLANDKNNTL